MAFLNPKIPSPKPPPSPPTRADASVLEAGQRSPNYTTYLGTAGAAAGLKKKATTSKPTLLGGGM